MKKRGLAKESAPADSQLLLESLLRVWGVAGRQVGAAVTDRGFASAANSRALADSDTVDATRPRNPEVLRQKMEDETFARLQRRRLRRRDASQSSRTGFWDVRSGPKGLPTGNWHWHGAC